MQAWHARQFVQSRNCSPVLREYTGEGHNIRYEKFFLCFVIFPPPKTSEHTGEYSRKQHRLRAVLVLSCRSPDTPDPRAVFPISIPITRQAGIRAYTCPDMIIVAFFCEGCHRITPSRKMITEIAKTETMIGYITRQQNFQTVEENRFMRLTP